MFWFRLPEPFRPLDLGADAGARIQQLCDDTPTLAGTDRVHLAVAQEVQIERMRRAGIGYAATCAVRFDEPTVRISIAQFTATVTRISTGNGFVLEALARAHGARRGPGRTEVVASPLGRALLVEEESDVVSITSAFGRPGERHHQVRHLHLFVPHPDRQHLLSLSIATECREDVELYLDVLHDVGRSLSVSSPSSGGVIAAVLGGQEFQP